jgi:hypothetical protein
MNTTSHDIYVAFFPRVAPTSNSFVTVNGKKGAIIK